MERQSVGVQTNWEEKNNVPSLEELQHRLCKLITDCGTDNDVPNMRSPTDMESSLHYKDIKNMTPVTSKQTEFLPKDGVTNITAKNEETYAVAMFCNRSGRGCNAIGEVYVVDIESDIPSVKMLCMGGIPKLLFGKNNSSLLFGGSLCGAIHVWDVKSQSEISVIPPSIHKGHIDPIISLESLTRDTLLSVDVAGKAITWDLRNLAEPVSHVEWEIASRACRVSSVCRGSTFYCSSLSGKIYKCNSDGISQEGDIIHESGIIASSVSTVGPIELLATSSLDSSIKVWDPQDFTMAIYDLLPSINCTVDMAWHPTITNVLATADDHGNVSVWNFAKNRMMPVCSVNHDGTSSAIAWTPSGKHLIVGGYGVSIFEPEKEVLHNDHESIMSTFNTIKTTSYRRFTRSILN